MGIDQKRRALAVTLLALNTRKGKYVEDTQKNTQKKRMQTNTIIKTEP